MAKYCIDTSGLSHPYEEIPEDIHESLWKRVRKTITDGHVAVTKEIFDEVVLIHGGLGAFLNDKKALVLHEIEKDGWDWKSYVKHAAKMQIDHKAYISEFCGGKKTTVCLNDISIIALAKTLKLPLVSMEKPILDKAAKRRHIPDICASEKVEHMSFSDFCRKEHYHF
jgi:Domain of unknown function (DUF4411)